MITKHTAIEHFRYYYMPDIKEQEDGVPDYPLRSESWNNFTDSLCKDGQITVKQYEDWEPPRFCWSPGEWKRKKTKKIRMIEAVMES